MNDVVVASNVPMWYPSEPPLSAGRVGFWNAGFYFPYFSYVKIVKHRGLTKLEY